MEKTINIIEILKDAPEGTPLYSPICGTVILDSVNDDYIYTYTADKGATVTFFSDGKYLPCPDAECMLFPSKDNRDWDMFNARQNFKKGDFVTRVYDNGEHSILLMGDTDWSSPKSHVNFICYLDLGDGVFQVSESHYWGFVNDFCDDDRYRLATADEKEKLIDAIDKNGYVWDDEKLELRKKDENPKFKKGDIITRVFKIGAPCILLMDDTDWSSQDNPVRFICYKDLSEGGRFNVSKPNDCWCTVGEFDCSTCRPATDLEKYWLIKTMNKHGYTWDEEKLELRKKEYEFEPYEKVLIRDSETAVWCAATFSHINENSDFKYNCGGTNWKYCIPYKGNESLRGTANTTTQQ